MYYIRMIPYIFIIILLSCIVYLQYSFNNDIVKINNDLIRSRADFNNYRLLQKENQLIILSTIQDNNKKRTDELNNAITKINNVTNDNRVIHTGLYDVTKSGTDSFSSYTDSRKQHYIETVSVLFGECTNQLIEMARIADQSTEASITYHHMLEDQYKIINKYNKNDSTIK